MPNAGQDVIVVGASAGGVEALLKLVAGLPADLPAAVFVVVHTAPDNPGILPKILARAGKLPVVMPEDLTVIERGRIYVARPDHHLLVKPGYLRTPRGPQENSFRPAVDPLFRTAALAYGPRVVGVILSGGMDDGTHGLSLIKQHGGIAIAQDPEDALVNSMPLSAIRNVEVDYILPVAEIPEVLARLACAVPQKESQTMMSNARVDRDVAEGVTDALRGPRPDGERSVYTCPECGGVLWEVDDGKLLRFRCHVGHGYTAESLLADQAMHLEGSFWAGLRALEENADLRRRIAKRLRNHNFAALADQYDRQAEEAEKQANAIRGLLNGQDRSAPHSPPTGNPDEPGAASASE